MFAASAVFACSSASSGVVSTNALSFGFSRSMRCRYERVSSVDETSRRRTAAAWSRADANGSMTVNGADSGGRVWRGGQRLHERVRILRGDGDQQAAARLRVAEHHLVELGDAAPIDLVAIRVVVAPAAVREQVAPRELANAVEEWDRRQVDVSASGDVGEVADEPVPRDVGGGACARRHHRLGGGAVEGRHDRDRLALQLWRT